jgi:hypothetical protein
MGTDGDKQGLEPLEDHLLVIIVISTASLPLKVANAYPDQETKQGTGRKG